MYSSIEKLILLTVIFSQDAVVATKLSHKEYSRFTNGGLKMERKELDPRGRGGNYYINIAKGIFNSNKGNLIQNVAQIPCDTIATLETDAGEAEAFVNQIQAGQVPSIIANLPQEAISEFGDIVDVATMVIDDVAGAAVTDVINVFNEIEDGSILTVTEGIPNDIIDAITNGWNDFTNEVTSVWGDVTCFFEGGCSSSSAGFCSVPSSVPASASASASASNSGGAVTSAYYTFESSSAAAAAATSAYQVSESSVSAAAAYTSSYYSSYYSAYYASESSAAAASSVESAYSVATAAPPDTATPTTPNNVHSISNAIYQSTTQQTATHSSIPAQFHSAKQSSTPPPQVSSKGSMSYEWADFSILAMVACGIFGLAIFL